MWPPAEHLHMAVEEQRARQDVSGLLGALLPEQALRGPIIFVAAHPDDVVRGASWLLRRSPAGYVVHVTDGAPWSPLPSPPGTPPTREAHARLLEQAAFETLALAGLNPDRLLSLGTVEQMASQELVTLTQCLLAILKALRPSLLVVHPYEGGHPDHDAAAFVSHAAVALLQRGGRTPPVLLEMATPECGQLTSPVQGFLSPLDQRRVATATLSEEDRLIKRRMLACYNSRGWDTQVLTGAPEHYRLAPRYDFTRPSRAGTLLYGSPTPRMTAVRWRRLARQALDELKLTESSAH
ncbi:MAG: PIG-L family deacetylase [Cystobacter sp.]